MWKESENAVRGRKKSASNYTTNGVGGVLRGEPIGRWTRRYPKTPRLMNLKTLLFTVISMTLPTATLCAQENATPPPAPNAPQGLPREGGPRGPDGQPRPEGQRGGGEGHHGGQSLFDLLDTNHDGVIDADELKNAPEVLKKLDRKGDGKITRDEFFPQMDGRSMRRPPGDNAQAGSTGPAARRGRASGAAHGSR